MRKHVSALFLFILSVFSGTLLIAQVAPPAPYAGNVSINYIRVWDAVKPVSNTNDLTMAASLQTALMTTVYYDGLGRKIQEVTKQGSFPTGGTAADLVKATIYDELGREIYNYLPFVANTTGGNASLTDGMFKLNPFQQQSYFHEPAIRFPKRNLLLWQDQLRDFSFE